MQGLDSGRVDGRYYQVLSRQRLLRVIFKIRAKNKTIPSPYREMGQQLGGGGCPKYPSIERICKKRQKPQLIPPSWDTCSKDEP